MIYLKFINQALSAAKYHEDLAFSFAHPDIKQYSKVVVHLRAYFWELWSVWDYILQEANLKTLKLKPEGVRRNFLDEAKKKHPNYEYIENLEYIQKDERLTRIMLIRDHAHKWQIDPYQVDYRGTKVNVICLNNLDAKDKKLARQINIDRNDLWFMETIVETLFKKGFFDNK